MEIDVQKEAKFLLETFEGATIIHDDDATKIDFQEDILIKKECQIMGGNVVGGSDKDESGQVKQVGILQAGTTRTRTIVNDTKNSSRRQHSLLKLKTLVN
jgi:hypothetical protein